MSVMFHDIHEGDKQNLTRHRVLGTNYDEIVYADDTICISEDTRAMNKFLASIEQEGAKYCMKLNKSKCELVNTEKKANVHFANGDKVKPQEEVKYLGCHLNQSGDVTREIKQRIANCMTTLKQLDKFWRHSSCPESFKIIVQDAVIRTKVLYGMESAELKKSDMDKLNVFQLKGLRKILKMETTFVNRENTNQKVFAAINNAVNRTSRTPRAEIKPFAQMHKEQKLKMYKHILNAKEDDPIRTTTINPQTLRSWTPGVRRSGRPKQHQWAEHAAKEFWAEIQPTLPPTLQGQEFRHEEPVHIAAIKQSAQVAAKQTGRYHNKATCNCTQSHYVKHDTTGRICQRQGGGFFIFGHRLNPFGQT